MNTQNSSRSEQLAERILNGAQTLRKLASTLTEEQWNSPVIGDGRSIGVVIHHVASSYPMEIELAQLLANGNAITGATMEVVDQINATHASQFAKVQLNETLDLLRSNSEQAAETVRTFTSEQLDKAAPVSLNADAPLTCQFFIEDHALRHSFHHLAKIKASLD